jgi:copper chaperone CopZ
MPFHFLAALFFLSASTAFGEEPVPPSSIVVNVKGMVCSFCVQGVQKLVGGIEGVSAVEVDLDKGTVTIQHGAGAQVGDEAIEGAVRSAGYNVESISRPTPEPLPAPVKAPSASEGVSE